MEKEKTTKKIIAKKDFVICHNEHHFVINKGDDIIKLGVPKVFHENLKTERVI